MLIIGAATEKRPKRMEGMCRMLRDGVRTSNRWKYSNNSIVAVHGRIPDSVCMRKNPIC